MLYQLYQPLIRGYIVQTPFVIENVSPVLTSNKQDQIKRHPMLSSHGCIHLPVSPSIHNEVLGQGTLVAIRSEYPDSISNNGLHEVYGNGIACRVARLRIWQGRFEASDSELQHA